MSLGFQYTTAIDKLRELTARKRVVQGGTSAGKTFGIIPILIDDAINNPGQEVSIVSESIPHLRRGAMKDFLKIMQQTGRYIDSHWNKSLLTYTFSNGSYIEFFSADMEGRLRGARRTTLYVNEANNIPFDFYHQMAIRTSGTIWLDFNPTTEFWAHTEVLKDDDAEHLILTYKDNEALPSTVRDEIEKARDKAKDSAYWANWWKVYGLGEIGSLQDTIFNFEIVDTTPSDARLLGYGLDFGFSFDPAAVVEVRMMGDDLYVKEVIYEKELTNQDLNLKLHQWGVSGKIVADSAEPKSIEELKRKGWNIEGAHKGADSIKMSIDLLQRFNIKITRDSVNLIKEMRGYSWDKNRTGDYTGKPTDKDNHAIDALRYVALNRLHKRKAGRIAVKWS